MTMDQYIELFPKQLEQAIEIGINAKLIKKNDIKQIIITGLGGSGIGGNLVNELVQDNCILPIQVNKDYYLPSYVNSNTLVIVSSYSGNTEETIQCMEQAIRLKAQIICITSGGKVAELAQKNGYDLILVPGGNPPRTCLGYSVVQLLTILKFNGFISIDPHNLLKGVVQLLESEKQDIKEKAQRFAEKLKDKIPVIYTLGNTESIAIRFRQQINENSKMLCWHHVIPEMNHNELVGWRTKDERLFVIVLRTNYDYEKNIKRLNICKEIISNYINSFEELSAKGNNRFEQFFYLINLTDWISFYLAELNQVDAVEVKVIDHLKKSLAN